MMFVDVDGVRLAVNVAGASDAMPVVLLHGGGADKSAWDAVVPALAETHQTYAVDLRGFGDSDRPGSYSFEAMRDDVIGLLNVIDADRVDLIGHSMGGTVAWLVAEQHPERIAHLVVVDSPPPKPGIERLEQPERPDEDPPFDWDALTAIIDAFNDPDPAWWDRIDTVTTPTLLLAGGPTSHVPQELLTEVLELLPNGRVAEIPVGHHIHQSAPEQFLTEVTAFLAD